MNLGKMLLILAILAVPMLSASVNCTAPASSAWNIGTKVVCDGESINRSSTSFYINLQSGGMLVLNNTYMNVNFVENSASSGIQMADNSNFSMYNSEIELSDSELSRWYFGTNGQSADTLWIEDSRLEGGYAYYLGHCAYGALAKAHIDNMTWHTNDSDGYQYATFSNDTYIRDLRADASNSSFSILFWGGNQSFASINSHMDIDGLEVVGNTRSAVTAYGFTATDSLSNVVITGDAQSYMTMTGGDNVDGINGVDIIGTDPKFTSYMYPNYVPNNVTVKNLRLVDNNPADSDECEYLIYNAITTNDVVGNGVLRNLIFENCSQPIIIPSTEGYGGVTGNRYNISIVNITTINSGNISYDISVGNKSGLRVMEYYQPTFSYANSSAVEGVNISADDGTTTVSFLTGASGYPEGSENNLFKTLDITNSTISRAYYNISFEFDGSQIGSEENLNINYTNSMPAYEYTPSVNGGGSALTGYAAKYSVDDLQNLGIDLAGSILNAVVQFAALIVLVGLLSIVGYRLRFGRNFWEEF